MSKWGFGFSFDMELEKPLDFFYVNYKNGDKVRYDKRPHGQWIPCSERLPKRDELVLVSYKTGGVHLCKYLDDGSKNPWWSYIDDCCAWNNTVDAWMPLPEPYKEEGDRND